MTDSIRVLVNGARGRMGRFSVETIDSAPDLSLAGATDKGDDLGQAVREGRADVVVDFTHPSVAMECFEAIVTAGARPVSGTTGFTREDLERARRLLEERESGGMIVPNFSVGMVLSMRFAAMAARVFSHAEIVEMHHDRKADAPSGTAERTAKIVAEARGEPPAARVEESVRHAGVRGGRVSGVPVHSIRLPGATAHQEVIFSGDGELLTLRHDALSRDCYRHGILLAIRAAPSIRGLVVGLDDVLHLDGSSTG